MTVLVVAMLVVAALAMCLGLKQMTFQTRVSGDAFNSDETVTVSGEAGIPPCNPIAAAAVVGTLSTRTNNTSGTLTMGSGHGLTTGQRVDLYWSGGKCYGAVLGTVSGLSCPIASVEGGDNLPAATTEITVGPCNQVTCNFVGDNLQAIAASSPSAFGYIVLHDGTTAHLAAYVGPANGYSWRTGTTTNPVATDTVNRAYFSTRSTTAITDMNLVGVQA